MNKNKFSWKAFISINLAISFIIILVSGTILFIAPPGRVAHWVNWKLFGLLKEQWQSIHTVFSYIFTVFGVFHLFSINWKSFLFYLKSKTTKGLNKKKEIYFASFLTIAIISTSILNIAPSSNFMKMGETIKEHWENKEEEAPIAHAEKLTLVELSLQLNNITIEQISNKLERNNIQFLNKNIQTLEEIGIENKMSPFEIYSIITKQEVGGFKMGAGLGRKTILEISENEKLDIALVIKKLQDKGYSASKDQTLKEVAQAYDMPAKDIYEIIISTK